MTDGASLTAYRLADSFLPVGTNSLSYGLEQFVAADRVADADGLQALLATYLRRQLGSADLVALRAAHGAARDCDVDGVCEADRRLGAATPAAEFRESAEHSGARLLSLQRELRDDALLDAYADRIKDGPVTGQHPVVLGAVAGVTGIQEREACLVCCHGFVTGLLGAAQRLLSFGHTDAQCVLDDLQPVMREAIDDSATRGLDGMTTFTPLVDIISADHERADRRLFMS